MKIAVRAEKSWVRFSAWDLFPSYFLLFILSNSHPQLIQELPYKFSPHNIFCKKAWPRYYREQWSMTLSWKNVYNFLSKNFITETWLRILRAINNRELRRAPKMILTRKKPDIFRVWSGSGNLFFGRVGFSKIQPDIFRVRAKISIKILLFFLYNFFITLYAKFVAFLFFSRKNIIFLFWKIK